MQQNLLLLLLTTNKTPFFCFSNCWHALHPLQNKTNITSFSFFLVFIIHVPHVHLHPHCGASTMEEENKGIIVKLPFVSSLSIFLHLFSFSPLPNVTLLSHLMLTISLIVAPPTPLSSKMVESSNLIVKLLLSYPQLKICTYHLTQISPLLFLLYHFLCIKPQEFFKKNPPTPFTSPKVVDFGFVSTSSLSLTLPLT